MNENLLKLNSSYYNFNITLYAHVNNLVLEILFIYKKLLTEIYILTLFSRNLHAILSFYIYKYFMEEIIGNI